MNEPGKTIKRKLTDHHDAKTLLLKANLAHGGHALDIIKTMRYSAVIMGVKAISYTDIYDNKLRIELWENGQLVSVEQMDGNDGWRWLQGKKAPMPPNRVAEMKSTFYSGLLGLRKPALNQMQVLNMQKLKNNTYSVLCRLDGNDYIFAINSQNQLVAEANKTAGRTSVSALFDLRAIQGIIIPFKEVVTTGFKKLVIEYDDFEINPGIDNSTWDSPAGV
ncbi:hypothetical protein SNE25_18195 [Mucilaginibacter sabulilitoris]|uniref:Uncharacterized protein n=1 Tax=Mucilaginibacter sabulilitoris TaxID=1173583 RepID=A0ABZ0TI47_9SPHI|nr:hypothetical protein [Mucilaginibacter sabulilitoris]WPU91250.1 hypothetical protein SNE25_18195 [Mucilaginibacter sabulilitoris]